MDVHNQVTGMGGVVWDFEGEVLASICSSVDHSTLPILAEALTLRKMMILCAEMGFTQLCFEGDCLGIVNVVRGVNVGDKLIGSIILDIQQLLSSHSDWTTTFVSLEFNTVVHTLVKLACIVLTKTVWLEEYLVQIAPLILRDVTSFALIV